MNPWQLTAFIGGCAGYTIILLLWKQMHSPDKFAKELTYGLDPDKLKSKASKLRSKISRHFRFMAEVVFAARWSVVSVAKHLLFACGFTAAIFLVTLIAIQPFLTPEGFSSLNSRLAVSIEMLGLGLLDALTFGLFEVIGIELRPDFPSIEARLLIFAFYALTGIVLLRAIILAIWDMWTVLVAVIFPEPMTRLANEHMRDRKVGTRFRTALSWLTTLGDDS